MPEQLNFLESPKNTQHKTIGSDARDTTNFQGIYIRN